MSFVVVRVVKSRRWVLELTSERVLAIIVLEIINEVSREFWDDDDTQRWNLAREIKREDFN